MNTHPLFTGTTRQGKPFFMVQRASESITGADRTTTPCERRAAHGLQAAFRVALLLDQPIIPFVTDLCRGTLQNFAEQLAEVNNLEVTAHLSRFLGQPSEGYPWQCLAEDQALMDAWDHLKKSIFLAHS